VIDGCINNWLLNNAVSLTVGANQVSGVQQNDGQGDNMGCFVVKYWHIMCMHQL